MSYIQISFEYFLYVKDMENQSDTLSKHISSLDNSILSKAFNGRLVPQDPNDEPALILLERIRKEKTSQTGVSEIIHSSASIRLNNSRLCHLSPGGSGTLLSFTDSMMIGKPRNVPNIPFGRRVYGVVHVFFPLQTAC